jgi:hypothetical protein
MGLALLLFALWLRLGRLSRRGLRFGLFLLLMPLLWTAHAFGWGFLSLLIFVAACAEAWRLETSWPARCRHVLISCLPLLPPVAIMLAVQPDLAPGATRGFFMWSTKLSSSLVILRNGGSPFDLRSAIFLYTVNLIALISSAARFDRLLGAAAALLAAIFLLMPEILTGSAFAATRLAPFVVAIALLAIAPRLAGWRLHLVAAGSLAFFLLRMTAQFTHYVDLDRAGTQQLAALDHVPRGSRVFVMASVPCFGNWNKRRMEHLGALAIARREAFANGQWTLPGAQLLTVRYPAAPAFAKDPPRSCRRAAAAIAWATAWRKRSSACRDRRSISSG